MEPHRYALRKTWDCWSAGTEVEIIGEQGIEKGSVLVRIKGEQWVIPWEYIVRRRQRSSIVSEPESSHR